MVFVFFRCPSSEDIKYRMTRVSIDSLDLYLQENGTATQIWVSPIRVSTCNLHGQQVKAGVTGILPTVLVRQFVSAAAHFANNSNTNTTASGKSHNNNSSRLSGLFCNKSIFTIVDDTHKEQNLSFILEYN
jgi:hypothetical protein